MSTLGESTPIPGKFSTECLSVVGLQMEVPAPVTKQTDIEKNLERIIERMEVAATGMPGTDIMVTPETALHGFSPIAHNYPIKLDGPEVKKLQDECKKLETWLVVGAYVDLDNGEPVHNVAITITDEGKIANVYSKTRPWNPIEPTYPGNKISVFNGPKGSKIATIICSDGDYLETALDLSHSNPRPNLIIRLSAYMNPYAEQTKLTTRILAYSSKAYTFYSNLAGIDSSAYSWFGESMLVSPSGQIENMAPRNVEDIFKVDIFPGYANAVQKQSLMGDLPYLENHRGGAHPATKQSNGEIGLGNEMDVFRKRDK